ncbi:glycosyltransferase [Paenibacillus sp. MBLB4367]|uniref:glycosyltransferase n=1 Tax=Paenibacillus sp. MBLB4367 TaxID=3384767 RepID=UPI0039082F87
MFKGNMPLVSLIIPVKNEGTHLCRTVESALEVKTEYPFEIVVVDDGSTDHCCDFLETSEQGFPIKLIRSAGGLGVAMARNCGAGLSAGDYLIFCDAHLFFEDLWIDRLLEPIRIGKADAVNPGIGDATNPGNAGYGYRWTEQLEPRWNRWQSSLFPSSHLAGGCFAISRNVFFDVGGFDKGFKVWGREDEEISLKLWLFGYKCYVVPNVNILHVFRSDNPPFKLTWEDVDYNFIRMAYSHFKEERIAKCKKLIKYSDPEKIEALVLKSDVLEQRRNYFSRRQYDDDWYMTEFGVLF